MESEELGVNSFLSLAKGCFQRFQEGKNGHASALKGQLIRAKGKVSLRTAPFAILENHEVYNFGFF